MTRDDLKHTIEVKTGNDGFKVIEVIERTPRQHSGWQSVTYKGRRYQLFGGVRVNEFIDVDNPIKRRGDREQYRTTKDSMETTK